MKIIAIFDNNIGAGGGFDQALNALLQMQRLSRNGFDFEVFTTYKENIPILNKFGIKVVNIEIKLFDRFLAKAGGNGLWRFIQLSLKLLGPLEKKLIRHGCDAVYFVTPSILPACLQRLNYINTVWDLCHRDTPEFPEVRDFNTFFIRENNYRYSFGPALVTLTDSVLLADNAAKFYGMARDRFIEMPFAPSPFLADVQTEKVDSISKYQINSEYFYYPAQFWPHKNHIRILQALKFLRDECAWTPKVVFSGKDYGNLGHIDKFIKANNLDEQVKVLGFVPSEDIRSLYENALAIVMPTYFGPTNLPPLEAWLLNVPLIYSSYLAEQAGSAALLVDPDDAMQLAGAMRSCRDSAVRERLIRAGQDRLLEIGQQRLASENKLCAILDKFAARRQCWA